MVDVDGSSQFSVDLQPKSIGLVSWSGGGAFNPTAEAISASYSGGRLPLLSARPAVTPPPTVRRLLPILLLGEQQQRRKPVHVTRKRNGYRHAAKL